MSGQSTAHWVRECNEVSKMFEQKFTRIVDVSSIDSIWIFGYANECYLFFTYRIVCNCVHQ